MMNRYFATCSAMVVAVVAAGPAYAQATYSFNLPAQSLAASLRAVGSQTRTNIVFQADTMGGRTARPLRGTFTARGAVEELLRGSGLRVSATSGGTLLVQQGARETTASPRDASPGSGEDQAGGAAADSESAEREIVVTGTNIRGGRNITSPVTSYDRDTIERTGASTVEDLLGKIPQNFSSVSSLTTLSGNNAAGFPQTGRNLFLGAGVNLHGLGPGATLTLIDSRRVAGGGLDGSFADISAIPLAAIERVDILTDGASAIYGADAIAGVVNVRLRRDYSGFETSSSTTLLSSGDWRATNFDQLAGHSWSTGNISVGYSYRAQQELSTSDLNSIPSQRFPRGLLPSQRQHSALANLTQDLWQGASLRASGLYSRRRFELDLGGPGATAPVDEEGGSEQYSGALNLIQRVGPWSIDLQGNYSQSDQVSKDTFRAFVFATETSRQSELWEVGLNSSGPLFTLPAGQVRLAIGGSYRDEALNAGGFSRSGNNPPTPQRSSAARNVLSAYIEASIPVVGSNNTLPWVRALDLSVAVRYDRYSDAGDTINPKAGAAYSPFEGLRFRFTWGTSFRAPSLNNNVLFVQSYIRDLGDIGAPGGRTASLLFNSTGLFPLSPEKARSWTAGFDVDNVFNSALRLSATYFDIRFQDRIANPPIIGGTSAANVLNQAILQDFIIRNPTAAVSQSYISLGGFLGDLNGRGRDADDVLAILNVSTTNIARTRQTGVDVNLNWPILEWNGQWSLSGGFTRLVKNDYSVTPVAAPVRLLNLVGQPANFRARSGLNWTHNGSRASLMANHVGGYVNTLVSPARPVSSWTTIDAFVSTEVGGDGQPGLTLSLAATNLLGTDPPFVAVPVNSTTFNDLGFDPTNADPFGRRLTISARMRW